MRLQDAVFAAGPTRVQTSDGKIHDLPGPDQLSRDIAAAPVRYVLDDSCAALVTHTAFAQKNTLDEALDLLRFPTTAFWIEWHDAGRAKVMNALGLGDPMADPDKKGRIGAYVTADESGRRGEISILWEDTEFSANLSPFVIEFDFDDPSFAQAALGPALTRSVRLGDTDILHDLYACARYKMREPWRNYYETYSNNPGAFEAAIHLSIASVAIDLPFIAAFVIVLSARGALHYEPSRLAKLNAARARKGKQPLLDHVNVSLELDPDAASLNGGVSGADRGSPRLHHVCGHLVRRGDSLHWRRAHLRGNPATGLINTRTVEVKTSQAPGGDAVIPFKRISR